MVNTEDNEFVANVRNMKHGLIDIHKEIASIKRIPYRGNPYYRGMRELKLADARIQEAIAWLDNAIFGMKVTTEEPSNPMD